MNTDIKVPYAKIGTRSKTLVLLPGLFTRSLMSFVPAITEQYKLFLDEYTIYFFDRIENPPQGYTLFDIADDTLSAIEQLKITEACVLGVSAGGMVAQIIASKRPDLVKKLVLASTTSRVSHLTKKIISEWATLAKSGELQKLNQSFAQNVYTPDFYKKYEEAILANLNQSTPQDLMHFSIYADAVSTFDFTDQLNSIKAKTLIIHGNLDKLFSKTDSELIASKTQVAILEFENYAHAVYDEAPDFLPKIFDWLQQ